MAGNDGVPPIEGVHTQPDVAQVPTDDLHTLPDFETLPDVHTQPDFETLPDVHTQPDFGTLPDCRLPTDLPDDCFPVASREELEMALHRAQLVLADCEAILEPAVQALMDGAWVSRMADEFYTGLTTYSRLTAGIGESCVETIQEALDVRGDDDIVEVRPL